MELNRQNIIDFLHSYRKDYKELAQNTETVSEMCRYLSPDSKITQYIVQHSTIGRDVFLMTQLTHPHVKEELIPVDLIVDENEKKR
jgi:hypothetical protein